MEFAIDLFDYLWDSPVVASNNGTKWANEILQSQPVGRSILHVLQEVQLKRYGPSPKGKRLVMNYYNATPLVALFNLPLIIDDQPALITQITPINKHFIGGKFKFLFQRAQWRLFLSPSGTEALVNNYIARSHVINLTKWSSPCSISSAGWKWGDTINDQSTKMMRKYLPADSCCNKSASGTIFNFPWSRNRIWILFDRTSQRGRHDRHQ